jgi:hypothetical protein
MKILFAFNGSQPETESTATASEANSYQYGTLGTLSALDDVPSANGLKPSNDAIFKANGHNGHLGHEKISSKSKVVKLAADFSLVDVNSVDTKKRYEGDKRLYNVEGLTMTAMELLQTMRECGFTVIAKSDVLEIIELHWIDEELAALIDFHKVDLLNILVNEF